MSADVDRYATAARAYFAYGVVYWLGGVYLVWHGVGVAGGPTPGRRVASVLFWALVGLVPMLLIPYLLRRRRGWFERWALSRRDFARLVTLFMAVRAFKVAEVAVRRETAVVAAPWGGEIELRTGAVAFFVVTVVALALVARAAWTDAMGGAGRPPAVRPKGAAPPSDSPGPGARGRDRLTGSEPREARLTSPPSPVWP